MRPDKSAALPLRGIILLLSLTILLLSACGGKVKPPVAKSVPEELPDQESWNSTVTFSDSGQVRAILQAGHIRMYKSRNETLLDSGVVVDFYGRDGEHTSQLTSKRGRVDDTHKDLEAFDDVVFRSDSGTVVETEYIYWENMNRKVRGDRFVTITSPAEKLQGYGFEADQDLKNYTVFGKVTGEAEFDK
ncbi:LPS export ABC transporter periplasmic protein LptC [bacterium]|nr:LPS export ABC transporter periplasmic protein LptC [bacterium]